MAKPQTQRQIAHDFLKTHGIARASELQKAGITATTLVRMVDDGTVLRLARGLYQLANAPLESSHSLAEAAKRLPKAVVCLVSALAYHGLTDKHPKKVWLAIGAKDWSPKSDSASIRIVRFTDTLLRESVETHRIEGVPVRIFGVAKTVTDCFRHRGKIGLTIALEGLQEALRQRKATPGEIARQAERGGIATVLRPYLEALTANG